MSHASFARFASLSFLAALGAACSGAGGGDDDLGRDGAAVVEPPSAPGASCGLGDLGACGEGSYCRFATADACGAADASGECAARPQACTREFRPACGCDGTTYSNACTAAAAGVSVAHDGACESACGGPLELGCGPDQFCQRPAGACGASAAEGTCRAKPASCTEEYRPVCGCDGQTYSNACHADAAGVAIEREGKCPPPAGGERLCGGFAGLSCGPDEVCVLPALGCNAADLGGTCRPRVFCTLQFDPVCGCDGKTYGNRCVAQQAGATIDHDGECAAAATPAP